MRTTDFIQYLKQNFPTWRFYNATIDRSEQCVGVYRQGGSVQHDTIGGASQASYDSVPFSLLFHWSENADTCEQRAIEMYNFLFGSYNFSAGTKRVRSVLVDKPVFVGRDNNVVEMVLRCQVLFERM